MRESPLWTLRLRVMYWCWRVLRGFYGSQLGRFSVELRFCLMGWFKDFFFYINAQVRLFFDVSLSYLENLLEELLLPICSWFNLMVPDDQFVNVCLSSMKNRSKGWDDLLIISIALASLWCCVSGILCPSYFLLLEYINSITSSSMKCLLLLLIFGFMYAL